MIGFVPIFASLAALAGGIYGIDWYLEQQDRPPAAIGCLPLTLYSPQPLSLSPVVYDRLTEAARRTVTGKIYHLTSSGQQSIWRALARSYLSAASAVDRNTAVNAALASVFSGCNWNRSQFSIHERQVRISAESLAYTFEVDHDLLEIQ